MAQWFAAKQAHPDALVFFRMGDFYELFFGDAEAAAAALDIALTQRGEHNGEPIHMCGVPVHAADVYLLRLIRRGFRVAVAEQMEDPRARTGKAPIRREVVRLVTPGTLTEDALLEAGRPNFLLALAPSGGQVGAAWIDVSTGLFETEEIASADLPGLLGRLDPAEVLAPPTVPLGEWERRRAAEVPASPPAQARRRLAEAFGAASLEAFGSFSDAEAAAAGAALDYVRATQAGKLPHLSRPVPQGRAGRMELDAATRASLEITRARDGGTAHTLLAAVQRTSTAAGARLLGEWLASPLTDPAPIAARQDGWSWLLGNADSAGRIRTALRGAPDVSRALARLSLGRGGPRDLAAVRDGLAAAERCGEALGKPTDLLPSPPATGGEGWVRGAPPSTERRHDPPHPDPLRPEGRRGDDVGALGGPLPPFLADIVTALDPAPELRAKLGAALADPAPVRLDDGAIAAGFDQQLDAERALRDDSRRVVATLQLDYAQKFGIASLKIRHHAQMGYVIEAPAAAVDKLRRFPELTLRQGMANGARFAAPELSELDRRISEAAERAAERERTVFSALCAETLRHAEALAACAAALAALDVSQSCARLADNGTWCRPEVSDDGEFSVEAGRHPVVEAALAGTAAFVPNDCTLPPDRRVLLLTGPNMAGKSTFLRQNALAAILAQAGLPVPAAAARIGIVDRLFSRVGAADDLARGRSTFMVEMTETAAILHRAGPRSLVVVDEIGRGTATLDGLAIAWAVLEALHNHVRCRVIFATHFHELAQLTAELPRLAPHTMRVKEWKQDVVFLHEVAAGAAGRSWGVHVAKLAGVPAAVVRRAGALLAALETRAGRLTDAAALPLFAAARHETAEPACVDPLREALAAIDPDRLAPRAALEELYRLKALLAVAATESSLTSA
jgi:DNA mismatch repair protein MutS